MSAPMSIDQGTANWQPFVRAGAVQSPRKSYRLEAEMKLIDPDFLPTDYINTIGRQPSLIKQIWVFEYKFDFQYTHPPR